MAPGRPTPAGEPLVTCSIHIPGFRRFPPRAAILPVCPLPCPRLGTTSRWAGPPRPPSIGLGSRGEKLDFQKLRVSGLPLSMGPVSASWSLVTCRGLSCKMGRRQSTVTTRLDRGPWARAHNSAGGVSALITAGRCSCAGRWAISASFLLSSEAHLASSPAISWFPASHFSLLIHRKFNLG